jgi:hypothetical protein
MVVDEYNDAIQINHSWRDITLGPLQVAVARDSAGTIQYEVVYSVVVDNINGISKQITWPRPVPLQLTPQQIQLYTSSITPPPTTASTYLPLDPVVTTVVGGSGMTIVLSRVTGIEIGMNMTGSGVLNHPTNGTPPVVTTVNPLTNTVTVNVPQTLTPGENVLWWTPASTTLTPGVAQVFYPPSLQNMREQVWDTLGRVNTPDVLPRWMTSQQVNGSITGYVPAWVLVYCNPGRGEATRRTLTTALGGLLNRIQFTVDRFTVDRQLTWNYEGTINTVPQWGTLPSAQPQPQPTNSRDVFILFPQKSILPLTSQE